MLVSLYGQKGITLDLPTTVTWETSNGQKDGSAQLTILRDSAAWSDEIVSEEGGFLVRIQTRYGNWQGIAESPEFTTDGMRVECLHLNVWASIRRVSPYRLFYGLTAGALAQRAVLDALIGLGSVPVTLGPVVIAPPVIAVYEFKGQTLLSVLTELSQRTGQQWTITEQMKFTWRQQIGRYREFTLIDDGRFLDRLQRKPLADQHRETIEIEPGGRTFTAHDNGVPALWPSQEIVRI